MVCRSISRQDYQSIASSEQAETNRSHGKNRGSDDARKNDQFHFPQPERSGLKVITLKNHPSRLRRRVGLSRNAISGRTRSTNRACRSEWRGQIDVAQVAERGLSRQHGCPHSDTTSDRILLAEPNRRAQPTHTVLDNARDTAQRVTEQFVRTLLGCFLFSRRRCLQNRLCPERWRKVPTGPCKVVTRSAESAVHGRADDTPRCRADRCPHRRVQSIRGTLIFISHDVYFIRALATSVLHVTAGANRTGGKLTFYPGDYDYYLDKSKATSAKIALTADRDLPELNGQQPEAKKQNGSGSKKQKGQKRLEAESRNAIAKGRRERKAGARTRDENRGFGKTTERTSRGAGRPGDLHTERPCHCDQSRSLRFVP